MTATFASVFVGDSPGRPDGAPTEPAQDQGAPVERLSDDVPTDLSLIGGAPLFEPARSLPAESGLGQRGATQQGAVARPSDSAALPTAIQEDGSKTKSIATAWSAAPRTAADLPTAPLGQRRVVNEEAPDMPVAEPIRIKKGGTGQILSPLPGPPAPPIVVDKRQDHRPPHPAPPPQVLIAGPAVTRPAEVSLTELPGSLAEGRTVAPPEPVQATNPINPVDLTGKAVRVEPSINTAPPTAEPPSSVPPPVRPDQRAALVTTPARPLSDSGAEVVSIPPEVAQKVALTQNLARDGQNTTLQRPTPTKPDGMNDPIKGEALIAGDMGPLTDLGPSSTQFAPFEDTARVKNEAALQAPKRTAGAALAHHVAGQIAAHIERAASGATEITLNPDELGKVRLVLHPQGEGLTLQVIADRPETAELMRRHIDTLAQDFKNLGYKSLSFDFSDNRPGAGFGAGAGGSGQQGGDPPVGQVRNQHQRPEAVTPPEVNERTTNSGRARAGLDLRL